MKVSRQTLDRLSGEAGFRPDTLEKVIRLGELAADIGRQPILSAALALKGGTALNLCFGAPRRLSVDLDFNYPGGPSPSDTPFVTSRGFRSCTAGAVGGR